MKTTKILNLLFLLLFASFTAYSGNTPTKLNVKTNTYEKLVIENSLSAADIHVLKVNTAKGLFTELVLKDYASNYDLGSPKVPVLRKMIEVPNGAEIHVTIDQSEYTEVSLTDIGGLFPLIPCQPSVSKSDDPSKIGFVMNNIIYKSNQFITHPLVNVEKIGVMRGINIARLDISPIAYNPVKKTIRIYTKITATIEFQNADVSSTLYDKERFYSPYFSNFCETLLNYKELSNKANLTTYPVKYVIVSDPMFQSTLQSLVQWKIKKGFNVIEAYTNNASVGTTTTSIKNYLQGLYTSATPSNPAPSFILLVGDVAQIPSFTGTTGSHVSDLKYAEYTGDFLPEVYYGRFSATNLSELRPQVDKTLEYEQYMMPVKTFLDTCVLVAGQDPNYGPTHADPQLYYGADVYFNASHGLYSYNYPFAISGSSAAQIIQNVGKGVCIANYSAHGSSDGWADPSFSVSDIASMHNNHKYPLMVGNCCSSLEYDSPACFGEALLRADGKGAVGYIGGSNSTYWNEDLYWAVGYIPGTIPQHPTYNAANLGAFDRTFHDHGEAFAEWFPTQGQMVQAGNLAVTQSGSSLTNYYWEIYHLMGDPSLMIYYSVPDPLTANYNALMPLGTTTFNITTNAPYCYAAISKNGVLYGAALADASGTIAMTLNPITVPGNADVVITGQNRQPYIGTVVVASPTGPYVINTKNHISGSDTLVDYNETNTIDATLKNFGAATANGVNATISSSDAYVTITDNSQSFGNIVSSGAALQTNAFAFTTAAYVPDQHQADFQMNITDNSSNTWSGNFSYKINAPLLDIGNFVIDDNAGNGNGALDESEVVTIKIESLNNGHANAASTVGTLTSTSPYVSIASTTSNLGTLNKSSMQQATFQVTVAASVPDTAIIKFKYVLQSGMYSVIKYYYITIGQAMEDWETNTFTKYDWVNDASHPWTITNVGPYEGQYTAKSGVITDNQNSTLSITMKVSVADSITFMKKVSSEDAAAGSWYDYLEFLIDGTSKEKWDGIDASYAKAGFPVDTGMHTFVWTYKKDYSVSEGDDCAWLDYIIFPPVIKSDYSVSEHSKAVSAFSCYPNPARGFSNIRIILDNEEVVSLTLMDVTGRLIEQILSDKSLSVGEHNIMVNMAKYDAGNYYYVLKTKDGVQTEKVMIVK